MRSRGDLGGQHKVPRVVLDPVQRAQLEALLPDPPPSDGLLEHDHSGNGVDPQPRLQ